MEHVFHLWTTCVTRVDRELSLWGVKFEASHRSKSRYFILIFSIAGPNIGCVTCVWPVFHMCNMWGPWLGLFRMIPDVAQNGRNLTIFVAITRIFCADPTFGTCVSHVAHMCDTWGQKLCYSRSSIPSIPRRKWSYFARNLNKFSAYFSRVWAIFRVGNADFPEIGPVEHVYHLWTTCVTRVDRKLSFRRLKFESFRRSKSRDFVLIFVIFGPNIACVACVGPLYHMCDTCVTRATQNWDSSEWSPTSPKMGGI